MLENRMVCGGELDPAEDRPECETCHGSGQLCQTTTKPLSLCDCEEHDMECIPVDCMDCSSVGYQPRNVGRENCEPEERETA